MRPPSTTPETRLRGIAFQRHRRGMFIDLMMKKAASSVGAACRTSAAHMPLLRSLDRLLGRFYKHAASTALPTGRLAQLSTILEIRTNDFQSGDSRRMNPNISAIGQIHEHDLIDWRKHHVFRRTDFDGSTASMVNPKRNERSSPISRFHFGNSHGVELALHSTF